MVQVVVRFNNVDSALKTLKRKLQKEGVLKALKLGRNFEPNYQKKKRKMQESQKRIRKVNRKFED